MEKLRMNKDEKGIILEAIKNYLEKIDRFSEINISGAELKKTFLDKNITKPTLIIPAEVYTKMFMYVDLSSVEIGWYGLVNRNLENQIYTVYDILMFPQENTSTHTTSEDDEYIEWMESKISDPNFPIEDLRLHGHSHVNMNVFSSATDDEFQRNMVSKVEDGDYYIFLILNKKRDIYALIYDFSQQVLFTNKDIDLLIPDSNGLDILTQCKSEFKRNCRTQKSFYKNAKATTNPEKGYKYKYGSYKK